MTDKEYKRNWYLKNKEKMKQYAEENKEHIKEYKKKYRSKNSDLIKIKQKKYVNENREALTIKWKEYRDNNQDTISNWFENNKEHRKVYKKEYANKNKKIRNNKRKQRKETDTLYKISENMRARISTIFRNKKFTKRSKTFEILGCSFDEFKVYLELKFEIWMSWTNHGLYNGELNYGWDIDHIIPISLAKTEEEIVKLNHYTNLQPLCSKVNRDIKKNLLV